MRQLAASIGGKHNARIVKTWRGSFEQFCRSLLAKVPETEDKASNGWVCGATFDPAYRDSENFQHRELLSLDYDHITEDELQRVLGHFKATAHLAYTTWSHTGSRPRIRVWLPLSRSASYDEFQAVSRRVAAGPGIEFAARESHTPSQYMYRPAVKPFEEFQSWISMESPWVQVDEVLATYENWTDRSSWPHRAEGDGVHNEGIASDPRTKSGIVGAFCRAFTITDAIEKFELPYTAGSSEGRLTYTDGSRPDGAIIYDDDTKLHSHHDTDPARGQVNAYDLTRLHLFGWLDTGSVGDTPLAQRASSQAMADFAVSEPTVQAQLVRDEGFEDLDATDTSWLDDGAVGPGVGTVSPAATGALPERIVKASSKFTDQENARRIQRHYGEKLVSVGGTFYFWQGTHWAQDEPQATRCTTHLSRIVQAEGSKFEETLAVEALKTGIAISDEDADRLESYYKWSKQCGQLSALNNCKSLLRDALAFDSKHLNIAAHLFSCANGTLNLRTGELTPHDPKNFITACSPITYDAAAEAPRFQRFLREVFNDDATVIGFAKRWFGYCLTGDISEHKMVFHLGGGGNGKSTLMDLLRHVLGSDYYSTAAGNLLTLEVKGATPELARLLGRRMVTIAETNEGLELQEGLVKQITGGDPITARMLYKDHFEFLPTHKLQVFTNFKPMIKGQDFAIWRRILLLDYPNSYGDAAQVARGQAKLLGDPRLEKALQAEAPGVLRWLVEGAKEWYDEGLRAPEVILAATSKYQADQDRPAKFASERLVADPQARTALSGTAGAVYPAYRGWCDSMGYRPLPRNRFELEMLRVMPCATRITWKEGTATVPGFSGIKLTDSLLDE